MDGIVVVNKPENWTSFDVVAIVRKTLKEKKVGHMGTLDPMATGVLPIVLGQATKFQNFIKNTNKEYIAKFKLGITTDTQDITGKVLTQTDTSFESEDILKILDKFKGTIEQTPPMFSAVKKDGKKLYELARRGIEVARDVRKIEIKSLELLEFDKQNQIVTIKTLCSKGTYIRSLCADIGTLLGCGATMTALQRTLANGFSLKDSITIEEVKNLEFMHKIFPVEYLFKSEQSVQVTLPQTFRFQNGGGLMLTRLPISANFKSNEIFKVYFENMFIGIGKVNLEKEELSVLKSLHNQFLE